MRWIPYRASGTVTFSNNRPPAVKLERAGSAVGGFNGKATTTVTFSEPGDYVLNVTANDYSGEGGGGLSRNHELVAR